MSDVSLNDALMHVGQHDLPFGGVGKCARNADRDQLLTSG